MEAQLPPTMGDIAVKAGVDRSTVSLALRNDPRIRAETRQRIHQIASEIGFRTNPTIAHLMALLRKGRRVHYQANLAALYLGCLPRERGLPWLQGAMERAISLGYGLELFCVRETGLLPSRLQQILVQRGIEGVVVGGLWGTTRLPDEYAKILDSFSCVCLAPHQENFHCVADDHFATAFNAVHIARQYGYDSIAMVGHSGVEEEIGHRFEAGYQMALKYGAPVQAPPVLILRSGERDSFLQWYHRYRPKVILCTQDEIRAWLKDEDIEIPGEVGLVHLDQVNAPKWAGMRQDWQLKGGAAVNVVVNQIIRNERGTTKNATCLLIPSKWTDGETIRRQSKPNKASAGRKKRASTQKGDDEIQRSSI